MKRDYCGEVAPLRTNGNGHSRYSGPLLEPDAEWPTMSGDAYHGVAGDVVRTIEPHSEADPVAILIQFLTAVGNIIGNCPYHQIEGDRHRANLFAVLVGDSAKARKGTAWGRVKTVARLADEQWSGDRTKTGLSSGEGFINEVRDPVKKWNAKEKIEETIDPGVLDKRLTVIEPEFAGVLAVCERHGNTLSPLLRRAWDGDKLATMTRSSPLCATGAHVSIVGHITIDELRARLTRTDTANGFANRFLYVLSRRSKVLSFGGDLKDDVIGNLGTHLKTAIVTASHIGSMGWGEAAAEVWKTVYGPLSEGRPGLLGAVTARGEAQCIRLAMIYALLDGATNFGLPHIRAALAIWEYAEASAAHIFGASLGDPVADDIQRALRQATGEGMTRNAIRDYFGRNQSSDRIGAALALLMMNGRARAETQVTGGGRQRSGLRSMVAVMGKYLDLIKRTEGYAVNAVNAVSPPFPRLSRLSRTLSALESRCPELVPVARWQQCVEDGRRFLVTWGDQAEALGWTSKDLFGLFPVPANPHPSLSRLSRYDHTGLIWLLQGKPVIALTEATAAIESPSGTITIYRKHNKPGLGPMGDSLDDFAPPFGGGAA